MVDKTNLISDLKRFLDGASKEGAVVIFAPHGLHEHSFDELSYLLCFQKDEVAEFTEGAHKAAVEISYPTFAHTERTKDVFLALLS